MLTVDSDFIINFFSNLNKSGLNYLLLRNIDNELPFKLKADKDIDILVKKDESVAFSEFLKGFDFKKIDHPLRSDCFLYGIDHFEFQYNKAHKMFLDCHYQLAVRSLDAGQWIPLDQIIQASAWENRRLEKIGEFSFWTLSFNDEFISLLARSIFDKRHFHSGYLNRLNELSSAIDFADVQRKFEKVFFKFTPRLIDHIQGKTYEKILDDYLSFKEY